MKKILYIFIGLLLIIPFSTKAAEAIEVKCPNYDVKDGELITCDVYVKLDKKISNVGFKINTSNNLEFIETTKTGLWESETFKESEVVVVASNYKNSGTKVCSFTVKSNSSKESWVKLNNIVIGTKENDTLVSHDNIKEVIVNFNDSSSGLSNVFSSGLITTLLPIGIAVLVVIVGIVLISKKKKK